MKEQSEKEISQRLKNGKLDLPLLSELLVKYTQTGGCILQGAQLGEDAAVVELPDRCLVIKTDPITFATDAIGAYAVWVNANDVVCMGADPKWFLASILLAEGSTKSDAERIFADIARVCRAEGIVYCGGHTEVTAGLDRPIVVGQMIGEAARENILLKKNIKVGDVLLLIKGVPIEAVSIIAREKGKELEPAFGGEFIERCRNFLYDPGISIIAAARTALAAGRVHALHDPTEGGVATAVHEMAAAAGLGAVVYREKVPIWPEGKLLCDHFGLDPLGTLASGALLAAVPAQSVDAIARAFRIRGIPTAEIGRMTPPDEGIVLIENNLRLPLPVFAQDEILKVFV
ncbi:MAG: AIR synthase-related protein [candidate division KSB1 bacterium]|nr:AIR synthase-related protein [candidate division KSB1 bacterium]